MKIMLQETLHPGWPWPPPPRSRPGHTPWVSAMRRGRWGGGAARKGAGPSPPPTTRWSPSHPANTVTLKLYLSLCDHEPTLGQYECTVSSGGGGSPTRQRARTVGAAGGETMKRWTLCHMLQWVRSWLWRELARRRIALARLKEETELDREADKESDPSPRMTIFKKTAINGGSPTSPVSSRSSRQQIFQVRNEWYCWSYEQRWIWPWRIIET